MQKKVLLHAQDIHKAFYHPKTVPILRGVNLTILQGGSAAIIGRSGEGKSTLLQILGTLEEPCQGSLIIAGRQINHVNRNYVRNQSIGFVFQSFHLLEDYTVLENVLMPARIAREDIKKGSLFHARAQQLLEQVGLADRMHFHAKLLSGGEKQRVALARAMCNDPDLIFADEPSGNLDRQTSEIIHQLLLDFVHQRGKSLILVTHDKELANFCQKQYELSNGFLHQI